MSAGSLPQAEPEQAQDGVMNTTPLTAVNRCDRCGAQAYLRADLSGSELLFCAHHARDNREALVAAGATLHDETAQLTGEVAGVSSVV